jgi:hypothetical protein
MSNTIKLLLIFITTQALLGCNAVRYISSIFHEEVVFFYASSDYPNEIYGSKRLPPRQTTLIFGPYMPNLGDGGGGFGGNYHPYKGPMERKEIIALWQVPIKDKVLRYYVRSKPNKGIIRAPRNGHRAYDVGVALGPMRVLKSGLSEEQLKVPNVAGYDFYGDPIYYRWGEWDKLYYITGIFTDRELQTIPRKFHEIQGIAITTKQYDKLYERCHSDWVTVKCFMDESFPDLTAEQLKYVKSRKHPSDDDRLAGKFPKPEPDVNHFK